MPSLKLHCAISRKRTKGYDFRELHKWIDEAQKELGYNHRVERHSYNSKDEKTIKNFWEKKMGKGWGKKAVVEWLFHIALDNLSTAFKKSKKVYGKNTFNIYEFGLNESGYIHLNFSRIKDHQVEGAFKPSEEQDEFDEDYFFEKEQDEEY